MSRTRSISRAPGGPCLWVPMAQAMTQGIGSQKVRLAAHKQGRGESKDDISRALLCPCGTAHPQHAHSQVAGAGGGTRALTCTARVHLHPSSVAATRCGPAHPQAGRAQGRPPLRTAACHPAQGKSAHGQYQTHAALSSVVGLWGFGAMWPPLLLPLPALGAAVSQRCARTALPCSSTAAAVPWHWARTQSPCSPASLRQHCNRSQLWSAEDKLHHPSPPLHSCAIFSQLGLHAAAPSLPLHSHSQPQPSCAISIWKSWAALQPSLGS